ADDEIDVGRSIGRFGHPATGIAVDAHGVGFVHTEIGAVFVFHGRELVHRRDVAEHAVEAFDDDKLVCVTTAEAGQTLVEIGRRVVTEADDGSAAQPASVIDAGVAVRVYQDVVLGAGEAGNDPEIGLVPRGEHHGR